MIRLYTTVLISLISLNIFAQFVTSNSGGYVMLNTPAYGLDALIVYNGIDGATTLTYTGSSNIEWRYNVNGTTYNSNQKSINPEPDILYTIYESNAPKYYIYCIDYSTLNDQITSLEIIEQEALKCEAIQVQIHGTIDNITYIDKDNNTRTLPRFFTLEYDDSSWNGSEWNDTTQSFSATTPYLFSIPAPKKSTTFAVFGDQLAQQMQLAADTLYASYTAISVDGHLSATIVEREYLNEQDRSSNTAIQGSGPLVVEFNSNVNPLDFVYYEWFVYNVETPNIYQRYNDKDLRYTFEDASEYVVRLSANTNSCSYADSVNVKVLESFIDVPNAFTPNGDGINDEFRVIYKSIERYSIIIQNRWGRTVYKSDNPGKGWDGRINGRPAAEGTYYYSILAYGRDVDYKGKKIKYRLSGAINLIR